MPRSVNKNCRVIFLPQGEIVKVPIDFTVMQAAQKAGVYLGSMCGSEGLCGKCKVRIISGITISNTAAYSINDIEEGLVLACQTTVKSDVTVEIPGSSLLDKRSLNKTSESGTPGETRTGNSAYPFDPLCRKVYLELPEPTLTDNLSDISRIQRELKRGDYANVAFGLDTIRKTPDILRNSDFKLTVTLTCFDTVTDIIDIEAADTSHRNHGIAVDIGTTSIVAVLVDLDNGNILGRSADYNSQVRYGPDVISRIMYAQESDGGIEELKNTVVKDIGNLVHTLVSDTGLIPEDINCILCSGNTTMTHMLLGIPPGTIRKEPYIPVISEHQAIEAVKLGLNIVEKGMIATLPSVGAYVGSDITAGVLSSGMADDEAVSMLIDIGTNGEIVLGNSDFLICCSASAGPAFEGAGTSCGMRAAEGAIEAVHINECGEISLDIIGGNVSPTGICGSGFISLIAELSEKDIIDRSGRFNMDIRNDRIMEGEDGKQFLIYKNKNVNMKGCYITETDIASFIRTKGAIYTAAEALLWHVGYEWGDISNIYISGAFGNEIDIRKSISVGLLPDLPAEIFKFIGNGSIAGAEMCLCSTNAFTKAKNIADSMTYFDLSTDPRFMNEYSASLFLPHTNIEKFPSVVSVDKY